MKHTIKEWRPGCEQDPQYLARQAAIRELDELIRATLAPTALGGVIDRAKADALRVRRGRLQDELVEFKSTLLVSREIEVPDGESYMTGAA